MFTSWASLDNQSSFAFSADKNYPHVDISYHGRFISIKFLKTNLHGIHKGLVKFDSLFRIGVHPQCMLQLPEVHVFIRIAWFVQYIWEVMMCVDSACVLNQRQVCACCINFSVHPRRLFLSSKCSSMVVLNDGTGFKAINSQNGEKQASVSCHLPRNRSNIGMVLFSYK